MTQTFTKTMTFRNYFQTDTSATKDNVQLSELELRH